MSSAAADRRDDGAGGGALAGLKVLDLSTVIAGPNCARHLADFGADVIKVERPGGDSLRRMAWIDERDGLGLWWKLANRNKRCVVLDLKADEDRALLLRLVDDADVLVENFRPGKLEQLGLAPELLLARNRRLVITRISGFGQTGPYRQRPGFASIAEAMSGFAAINGEPDGAPLLPPIALTDELTGVVAAFATMVAVHSGVGQVVDVSLLESLFQAMGPLPSLYALTGEQQPRLGSGLPYSVPRGTYRCADGEWVAVSTSSEAVADRVIALLGLTDERFAGFAGRVAHRSVIEAAMADFCAARSAAEVIAEFERADAAIGPVLDMAGIAADEHFRFRAAVTPVVDATGAVTPMQNVIARLSATPGVARWAGRSLDADGAAVRADGWTRPTDD